MFDFSKLGDISKMANEAKHLQAKQEMFHQKQIELLQRISQQLQTLISLIERKG